MALRRLGVYGENLPTKRNQSVVASDFLVAGLVGKFERKFDKAFPVSSAAEAQVIFGAQTLSGTYGWDAVNGFFANIDGAAATLFISSHVGYTGSAIDAVVASSQVNDTQGVPEPILRISAAFQGAPEFGVAGNRTGYRVELGNRFTTAGATAGAAADTFAILDSVSGIRVGDIVRFVLTGGGGATVFKKITLVQESTGRIEFSGAIHATANLEVGDVVTVPGFRVRLYRRSATGVETEVDISLGQVWLTTEPEVQAFYAPNVFEASRWATVEVLPTSAPVETKFPVAVTASVYLASGADGTNPSTPAQWERAVSRFNDQPIRMVANCETTSAPVQKALEVYCRGRFDNPKVIGNIAEDQTKAQLITIGQSYQRSDDVLQVNVAHWVQTIDPFNDAPNAPFRNVPSVGHVLGAWVRTIATKGVHYIPSTIDVALRGIVGIVGQQFPNDFDRTDLAEAGINCIEEVRGAGFLIRNFFTPSTDKAFQFANGLLMRDFIKVSAVESLRASENTPASFDRIRADQSAIQGFLYRLWENGSTGTVPRGETFGQSLNADGSATQPSDHFEVQADLVNNPQVSIEAGERNLDVWFTYPAPTGSIKIGVGILLRG